MRNSNHMARMSWPDVETRLAEGAIVLLPVGAQEGHGAHLPLGTDTIITTGVCDLIATRVDAMIAPPIPFGFKSQVRSGGGHHWPGNIGLDGDLLVALCRRIIKDLSDKGALRIAIINGHFENCWFLTEACNLATEDAKAQSKDLRIFNADRWALVTRSDQEAIFDPVPADSMYEHAALSETSLMLHLAPETVEMDKIPRHDFLRFPNYDVYPPSEEWFTETGVLAPVLNADEEKGRKLAEISAVRLGEALVKELGATPLPG